MRPRPGDGRRLVVRYGFALSLAIIGRVVWRELDDIPRRVASCTSVWGMRALVMFVLVALVASAVLLARRGWRVRRAGRVPLADDPVLVDTRVRRGNHVAWEARACFVIAATLLVAPLVVGLIQADALRVVFARGL